VLRGSSASPGALAEEKRGKVMPKPGTSVAARLRRELYAFETRRVGVASIDLYCARRRDWSFAAAEVDGEGEKDSESGEEVCG